MSVLVVSASSIHVVNIGRKPIRDYVFEIIVNFQEGVDKVVIKGYGRYISKAVDVYNRLRGRLGDSISIDNIEINSEKKGPKLIPYIAISVMRRY
ncbi:MAG: DNA-binding protein [Desulfurococcaceae archaeon]